jgi:hypothetical protein
LNGVVGFFPYEFCSAPSTGSSSTSRREEEEEEEEEEDRGETVEEEERYEKVYAKQKRHGSRSSYEATDEPRQLQADDEVE